MDLQESVDHQFDSIVGNLTVVDLRQATRPEDDRITVLLDLPHLKQYGHDPTRELTYGCNFEVKVGDQVRCPPTPFHNKWTVGLVVGLSANGYKGPVKYVKPMEKKENNDDQ